jgi:Zn-dependent oligopeptidase
MNMVVNYRKTFRQYRDQVRFKFSQISNRADKCVVLMKEFASDSTTEEMMEAFMGMMRELQKYIDIFVSIFSNLNSAEFRNHLISTIDSIKKQMNQIRQLINDRILEHIDNNILAKDWASEISEQSDIVVEEKIPLVLQLFRERQKALKG